MCLKKTYFCWFKRIFFNSFKFHISWRTINSIILFSFWILSNINFRISKTNQFLKIYPDPTPCCMSATSARQAYVRKCWLKRQILSVPAACVRASKPPSTHTDKQQFLRITSSSCSMRAPDWMESRLHGVQQWTEVAGALALPQLPQLESLWATPSTLSLRAWFHIACSGGRGVQRPPARRWSGGSSPGSRPHCQSARRCRSSSSSRS